MKLNEQIERIKKMMGVVDEQDDSYIMKSDNTRVSNPRIDYLDSQSGKDLEKGDKIFTDIGDLELTRKVKSKDKILSSLKLKGRGPEGHKAQIMQMKKDGKGNMDNWESRNGYDLMCEPGTIVKTPIDGTITSVSVSKSANRSVYGMSIKIKSTDGNDEIFMTHLDPNIPKVTQGQEVKKGDVVGVIGDPIAAGKSFAAHLHVSTKDENHTIFKYINDDMTFTT